MLPRSVALLLHQHLARWAVRKPKYQRGPGHESLLQKKLSMQTFSNQAPFCSVLRCAGKAGNPFQTTQVFPLFPRALH